ncbi:ribonuclease PH [Gaopeijia maritima]|uniref:ribonuclease PH n=1 Tax=Gaopeijia maritima TaxID=3119007 RepID=UPI00324C26DC
MTDRAVDALRPLLLEPGWAPYAEGSCLISTGRTRVLCTASVAEEVPAWRERSGKGWVTGEYGMLPRSTHSRRDRERDGVKGRTQEIQRLIGRSLRSVTDLAALGPRTITLDCDVLQADGGTRTASITGAFVALELACRSLVEQGLLAASPVREGVAAVSVGIVGGVPRLDLDYPMDRDAQVDMNVVATASGRLVEVQGTAEGDPFTREEHDRLLDLALGGIEQLLAAQREILGAAR